MSATQKKTPEIEPLSSFANLYGRRQVRQLEKFLQDLRQREAQNAHGNRRLFLADLFVAQPLAFHHPTVRSLRTLDALSGTPTAQRMLEVQRLPRSAVSDANKKPAGIPDAIARKGVVSAAAYERGQIPVVARPCRPCSSRARRCPAPAS